MRKYSVGKRLQYFNSIKVQLEQGAAGKDGINGTKFQFHKGTIRTTHILGVEVIEGNFNSIKVQLEQSWTSGDSCALKIFQFHKGTIRTSD